MLTIYRNRNGKTGSDYPPGTETPSLYKQKKVPYNFL